MGRNNKGQFIKGHTLGFQKGHHPKNEFKKGYHPPAEFKKGHIVKEKTRKKISKALKGKKNSNWKDGISSKNERIRKGMEFRLWREAVFARDNYTCQRCGQKGWKLHPHHIFNFSTYLDLRFAIDNGITFCEDCHKEFHKKYGWENNTKEQLEEFLINYS